MKLEGLPEWEATYDISDGIKLLKMIKSLAHQATDQKYYPLSLYSPTKIVYFLQKGPMMNNTQLVDTLKAIVGVVEEVGGSIGAYTDLIGDEIATYIKKIGLYAANAKTIHITEAKNQAQERYLSIILLSAEYRNRTIGRLLQLIKNGDLKGQSASPVTLSESLAMLNKY